MSPKQCFECGARADVDHHVVPKSRGGIKTIPLCDSCHGKAHGRVMSTNALTRDALARKKQRGERIGTVPLGFDLAEDGCTLIENAKEQETIALIRSLRAQGLSLQGIAQTLNNLGIPTKNHRKHWSHSTIQGLVGRLGFSSPLTEHPCKPPQSRS